MGYAWTLSFDGFRAVVKEVFRSFTEVQVAIPNCENTPTEGKDTLQYVWKIKSSENLCECLPAVLHLMHALFQEGHNY